MIRRWGACIVIGFAVSYGQAQWNDLDTDSMASALRVMPDDTTKLKLYNDLSWSVLLAPDGHRINEAGDSLALRLLQHPDTATRAMAAYFHGRFAYHRGYRSKFRRDMSGAVREFRKALASVPPGADPNVSASVMDALGVVYRAMCMPEHALRQFTAERDTLLKYLEGPTPDLERARIHRAATLRDLGRYDEALAELDLCAPHWKEWNAQALVERALVHRDQGDTTQCAELFAEAHRILVGHPVVWDRIPILEPAARALLDMGRTGDAQAYARECAHLADSLGDRPAWCGCSVIWSEALLRMGDMQEAERKLSAAMDTAAHYGYIGISRESGDEGGLVNAAGKLVDVYKRQGRTAEALAMMERRDAWKDTLRAIEGRDELLRFELQVEAVNDSIAEAGRLTEATRGITKELEGARMMRDRLIVLGFSVLVIGALVVSLYIARRKQRRMLAEQQEQQAEQDRHIMELRTRERMSEDLHEDLGAGLSALKLWSEMDLAEEHDPSRRRNLMKRSAMADELMTSLRQIIWALNSPATTVRQLADYLLDHAHTQCAQHGLHLEGEVVGAWPAFQLSAEQRRYPFLALREALANTVKHAGATTVNLRVRWEGAFIIEYADNGKGISGALDTLPGNGLRNMKRRIGSIGGAVEVFAEQGLRLVIRIPFKAGA